MSDDQVKRAELELARDKAALEAMFFWQLGDREKSAKWKRKGDAAAAEAVRLDAELNGENPLLALARKP